MGLDQRNQIKYLLKENGLRITSTRSKVLSAFFNYPYALSQADVAAVTNQDFDRVTLYRTLKTFLDNGIIHQVPDNESNVTKYALAHDHSEHEGKAHVHFKCIRCKTVECIEGTPVPEVTMPSNYLIKSKSMLVEGICKNCNRYNN